MCWLIVTRGTLNSLLLLSNVSGPNPYQSVTNKSVENGSRGSIQFIQPVLHHHGHSSFFRSRKVLKHTLTPLRTYRRLSNMRGGHPTVKQHPILNARVIEWPGIC